MTGDTPQTDPNGNIERVKRRLRPWLWLVVAAAVVYAASTLAQSWERDSGDLTLGAEALGPLALSFVCAMASIALQGVAWVLLVDHLSQTKLPAKAALVVYQDSQLARYLPGKVGLPLVRIAGARALGVSRRVAGLSIVIEMLSWVGVGAVVSLTAMFLFAREARLASTLGAALPVLAGAGLVGLLLLVATDRRRFPERVRRALGLDGRGALMPWGLPTIHVAYWLLWTLHGYFLSRGLGASSAGALSASGLFVLAPIGGFLVLVAPAGAGVREAILLGLAPTLGSKVALAIAVLSRALSLLADVSVWFILRAAARRRHSERRAG